MRTLYTTALSLTICFAQAQVTISTTGEMTFEPDLVSIEMGESVTFVVGDGHTATQVSEETWLANGDEPMTGGFDLGEGTHVYTPTTEGIIYFVCQPHADEGMKGQIHVINTVDIGEQQMGTTLRIFPNPASNEVSIETGAVNTTIVMIDVLGKEVLKRSVSNGQKLDISTLPEGNYTAILRDDEANDLATQRLMVTR